MKAEFLDGSLRWPPTIRAAGATVRLERRCFLRGIVLSSVLVVAGCGGGGDGCALAPGPCSGTFPDEHIPAATVKPSQLVVALGGDASFVVEAPGLTTLTYQWFRSTRGGALEQIVGATGASYTLVGAQPKDDGVTFSVLVDGGYGSGRLSEFSSGGTLTVR